MAQRALRDKQTADRLSAVEKALRILEAVAVAPAPISMAEIERTTGLARPTAHRVTSELIEYGYIERDPELRSHFEGSKLVGLAINVMRSSAPRSQRLDILNALSRDTGEASHFALLRGNQLRIVDQSNAPAALSVRYDDDAPLPAHCTASGKLLLAHWCDRQRDALLSAQPLTRHTERTITERRKLAAHLAEIRDVGYAIEDGEHIHGVISIAVPVLAKSGTIFGALGLSAPQVRYGSSEQAVILVPALKQAAARLAATLE